MKEELLVVYVYWKSQLVAARVLLVKYRTREELDLMVNSLETTKNSKEDTLHHHCLSSDAKSIPTTPPPKRNLQDRKHVVLIVGPCLRPSYGGTSRSGPASSVLQSATVAGARHCSGAKSSRS